MRVIAHKSTYVALRIQHFATYRDAHHGTPQPGYCFRNSAIEAQGPTSVGLFSCSKATNELNFITQKFMRAAVGSNNIDSCNRT